MTKVADLEFVGFDFGHGETALARVFSTTQQPPELLEYRGEKNFVTAIARLQDGQILLGREALSIAAQMEAYQGAVWAKFKARDVQDPEIAQPTRLFAETLITDLAREGKIRGKDVTRFVIGCPSGWSESERENYRSVFHDADLSQVDIVAESRAAFMSSVEQGYLTAESVKKRILLIDVGSSTTDFTLCQNIQAKDVGQNDLGSGLLDRIIFERTLASQTEKTKIKTLLKRHPHWAVIMEYWCRQAKEQYFSASNSLPVEKIHRLPAGRGLMFEIRIDEQEADAVLRAKRSELKNKNWLQAFEQALKNANKTMDANAPDIVLLTGGASRLPQVKALCEKVFAQSEIIRGAEPEYAIARGLAWFGRYQYLRNSFVRETELLCAEGGEIHSLIFEISRSLSDYLAPAIADGLIERVLLPMLQEWRAGRFVNLTDLEAAMPKRVTDWLHSSAAQTELQSAMEVALSDLRRDIENLTDPLCRAHGLSPMALNLDEALNAAQHLEDLQIDGPGQPMLEGQTLAIAGGSAVAVLGLINVQALVAVLLHPLMLIIVLALGVGGFFLGKDAIEEKLKGGNIPLFVRRLVRPGALKRAAATKREAIVQSIKETWKSGAADRYALDLTNQLCETLLNRSQDRALIFLL